MSGAAGGGALLRTAVRTFVIQGSWNYRTMIGNGFAFSLLPVLRAVHRGDREALDRAVRSHARHFNAHPYLAGVALGAVARMESEGADPALVHRFKTAVKGPLGGLGDVLVWAGWLPATLLVALVLAWAGVGTGLVVVSFVVLYNAGHVALRVWGFRVGLREGSRVGARLGRARLNRRADQVAWTGALLAGAFLGLVLVREPGLHAPLVLWLPLVAGAFALGVAGGQKVWRATAFAMVAGVIALLATEVVL